jgi:hypothetical protein
LLAISIAPLKWYFEAEHPQIHAAVATKVTTSFNSKKLIGCINP